MLRIWLEDGQESGRGGKTQGQWRASLEAPHTQEMRVFASLDDLFNFLTDETEGYGLSGASDPSPTPGN